MNIPKTLVIGINMHGEIHLTGDGTPLNSIVPENMHINIINAVVPGVPNISTLENYENLAENISEKVKDISDWNNLTQPQISEITQNIKEMLVATNDEQSNDIINQYQKSYNKGNINTHFKDFAHSYNKSFKITSYTSRQSIPDKLYLKFLPGEAENPNDVEENYFNKIVLYNLDGEPDIFELFKTFGTNLDQIKTSELIEFVVSLGVQNLIIIDLSCSVFKGEHKFLTERNIRQMRRTMMGKGRKTKRQRRKSIRRKTGKTGKIIKRPSHCKNMSSINKRKRYNK